MKLEVYGVKGMSSKSFRKVFANQAAFERWMAKNGDDVTILGTREIEA